MNGKYKKYGLTETEPSKNRPSIKEDRKTIISFRVGEITKWVRDILAIVLMGKIISIIF